MNPPKLEVNMCSVLVAKYATGHVCKKDLTIFLKGDKEDDVFQAFSNYSEAEKYALSLIKNKPEFECVIYNENGKHLKTYDVKGERKYPNDD